MVITRKIELWITGDKQKKNDAWKLLRKLDQDVFRAYNTVISHQFFNETFKERIVKSDPELAEKKKEIEGEITKLTDKLKAIGKDPLPENAEIKEGEKKKDLKSEKDKIIAKRKKHYSALNLLTTEARLKAEEFYVTSELNTTYQLLGESFPDMPSTIRTCINSDASSSYKNDAFDVKMGKKSISTYKKGIPIPFQKNAMRFNVNEKNEVHMDWVGGISFYLNFGRDKSNTRKIIDRAMADEYKYCDSRIQIQDRKIFLLFCVDIPERKKEFIPGLSVGANLGLCVPAYCALSDGKSRLPIGNDFDLLRVRLQMQARRKRLQSALKLTEGGRGRVEKLKALDHLEKCEAHYRRTYNHKVSYQIVKFALDNSAGVIKMELLEGYGDDQKNKFILRNWSYFDLHKMIEYKAKKHGIQVVYTDPHRISLTCNCCGQYNDENLESRNDFACKNPECKQYAKKVFSDYNAALNNAQSLRIVTKKEECEYHKSYEKMLG